MISTLHGAWWLTRLGTEPSRKRRAPVMPLLPPSVAVSEPSVPTTIDANTPATPQTSFVIAMTMPATTNTTMSACVHSQNGDTPAYKWPFRADVARRTTTSAAAGG